MKSIIRNFFLAAFFLSSVLHIDADHIYTNYFYDNNPEIYLHDRLPSNNGRYGTFKAALELLSKRNVRTIVETGMNDGLIVAAALMETEEPQSFLVIGLIIITL